MITAGFIGTGNMGGALARAAKDRCRLLLSNRHPEKSAALAEVTGGTASDNTRICKEADYIFLGVKPQMLSELAQSISPVLSERRTRFVIVTMAAGRTIAAVQELLGAAYPVIRIMPNTPAAIGEGMVLYACSPEVTEQEKDCFLDFMSGAGRFAQLEERLIDAGSAVSGCGPAFADMFIEALADGGVACGLPRALAQELAAQMLAGSAKLVLESGKHPGELKDAVCSPGGSTIQGVRTLEKAGFRGAVTDAVIAAYEKNFSL